MSGDGRLIDEDRLEAAGQGRVLLDIFAVFVERGRADAMQFAARQSGLQHVGGIHRAIRLAGADQSVQFVDEDDDLASRRLDFLEHALQPFLELAAELGAGDQRAEVERQQPLVLQALRHVAIDDALGQPLDDRGLADAGLADQHGVVLGAARQDLDGAANLLVAADHRVELAIARRRGQITGVFLQRLETLLGIGVIGGAALADLLDRLIQRLGIDAGIGQRLGRRRTGRKRDGEQ